MNDFFESLGKALGMRLSIIASLRFPSGVSRDAFWLKNKSHYTILIFLGFVSIHLYIYALNVCSLVGWGRISGGGPAADILQQAKLPLVSHTDCRKKYGSVDRNAHLCAGEGRAAASGGCNGDSGGPLACEMGGKWYLHGAVSFGKRNCPTTHFTVFARITSYKSWILNKIGD